MITLWEIQEHAVKKSYGKRGVLLWDDMGLGKTVTSLAEVLQWVTDNPDTSLSVLVLAKQEAHEHWLAHIRKVIPAYEVCFTLTNWQGILESYRLPCDECNGEYATVGADEKCHACNGRGYFIRYRTRGDLARRKWTFVLLDEAHRARNRKAKQREAIKQIVKNTQYIRFLSGTFIVNYLDDLWSPLNLAYPKDYSSYWRFFGDFVDSVEHNKGFCRVCGNQVWHQRAYREIIGSKNEDKLMRQIADITIGPRLKKGCTCVESAPICSFCNGLGADGYENDAYPCPKCNGTGREVPHDHLADLPDVLDPITLKVELSPQQRRAYTEMVDNALAWIGPDEDQPLPGTIAISRLTRLRQFASAYCELDNPTLAWNSRVLMREPSAKLDTIMGLIEDMPAGEPFVAATMFKGMLTLLEPRLEAVGIDYFRLDGDTPKNERADWMRFQQGERRAFIMTIPTGGESIELVRASMVIFLDRDWTNTSNDQVVGRLWRFGQRNGVLPVYLEARGTVDEVDIPRALSIKAGVLRKLLLAGGMQYV